jgi:fumarate reductase (CoM/CoB) subunit B
MRIGQAIEDVNLKHKANIAWRLSCREFLCGICTIMANGKPTLACKVPVENGMVLEPLPCFPIIKDLVIDRDVVENRLQKLEPWLSYKGDVCQLETRAKQSEVLHTRAVSECITCLACLTACPAIREVWEIFVGPMYQVNLAKSALNPLDSGKRIAEAAQYGLFKCTQCGACADVCPKGINIPEKAILQLRSLFLKEEEVPRPVKKVIENVRQKGNPFGKEAKWEWSKGLNLPKRGNAVLFAGCLSSFEFGGTLSGTLRRAVNILEKLGIKIAYYAEDELCCGAPLLTMGDEGEFRRNAQEMVLRFQSGKIKTVITGCAECYQILARGYPKYLPGTKMPVVKHISQVIAESINRLGTIRRRIPETIVTYHDPCRLGRDCGIYDAPREIIGAIKGIEFREMTKTRSKSFCCGAGGGVRLTNNDLSLEMGRGRMKQARETGSSMVISACPWCEQNLRDSMESGDGMRVLDIVDLIAENL